MNIKSLAVIALLSLSPAVQSFAADEKPDLRDVRWGMSKDEVKKHESAQLVKDGEQILIYKIEGGTSNEVIKSQSGVKVEGQRDAVIEFNLEMPDYDLVYVFPDGKLGMAVLHMNDPLAQPGDYIDEFGYQGG